MNITKSIPFVCTNDPKLSFSLDIKGSDVDITLKEILNKAEKKNSEKNVIFKFDGIFEDYLNLKEEKKIVYFLDILPFYFKGTKIGTKEFLLKDGNDQVFNLEIEIPDIETFKIQVTQHFTVSHIKKTIKELKGYPEEKQTISFNNNCCYY